jgi:hypothetical protein
MKQIALMLVLVLCLVAIVASVVDLRCKAMRATPDTIVLVCRASRL